MVNAVLRKGKRVLTSLLKRPVYPQKYIVNMETITCTGQDLSFISSSSVVIHVKTENREGFFFECRDHTALREYVDSVIADYFSLVVPPLPENAEDRQLIENSLKDSDNFAKFVSMGVKLYNAKSPCMEFLCTGCGCVIGLDTDPRKEDQINRLKKFIGDFAWCQLNSYHVNLNVQKNRPQTRETNIALAAQEVACLLKIDELLPRAAYVRLQIQGYGEKFGLLVEKARGVSILPYNSAQRRGKITPSLQRELLLLNLLDAITLEQDHSPNNYFVRLDDQGRAIGISAFDNKGIGAFPLHGSIDFITYKNGSSLIRKDGTINRPYLGKNIVARIEALKFTTFYSHLRKVLMPMQILSAWHRVKQLRRAITQSLAQSTLHLLDDSCWTEKTVEKELTGAYGKTYLMSFYSDVFLY